MKGWTNLSWAAYVAWCCALPATTTPEFGWAIVENVPVSCWDAVIRAVEQSSTKRGF